VSIDGVTVFGVGLILGGVALLVAAAVGVGRWLGGRGGRRPAPRQPARSSGRSRPPRPVSGRLADDRIGASVPTPGTPPRPDPRQANRGRMPRARDRRPFDGSPARRPAPWPAASPPPARSSALLANTVQLHPVPAWSVPVPPRNDPPRSVPAPPDPTRNNAQRFADTDDWRPAEDAR
jgi:hypothetical protein